MAHLSLTYALSLSFLPSVSHLSPEQARSGPLLSSSEKSLCKEEIGPWALKGTKPWTDYADLIVILGNGFYTAGVNINTTPAPEHFMFSAVFLIHLSIHSTNTYGGQMLCEHRVQQTKNKTLPTITELIVQRLEDESK